MLNFDEKRVFEEHTNGVNLVKEVEKIVDNLDSEGYSNIFLIGIGGTYLYADQIMHTAKQLGCKLPIYLENAQNFVDEGNALFDEKSIMVVASLSGHTIEVEKAIDVAHEKGAKVIGYVEKLGTPLAEKVDYLVSTFGAEYYWWYSVVLRFMHKAGQFNDYEKFVSQLTNMPQNVVNVYKKADHMMEEYANKYCDEPLTYLVGSGNLESWAICYGMCIMEEMQWMPTRPISGADFFHGTLEVIERDIPLILIKGEDKTRSQMERVEKFVVKISNKVTVFDTRFFDLEGIDEKFRWILSPIVMRSAFMRLNVHLEDKRKHPLDIRRYYKALDY
ncbi:SIS domain-containing protein [Enterococcus cecorum]|uniref:Fructosamine deglycase n=1 Tax=Enterococcus cecorum TaxID=44008 RepID=A0AAP6IT93_9ENTE|nr:SIS domain-containing protein [Enterococcus cecorum]KLO64518.1 sugar isomerase [Enterococcus cecorum]KLO69413.1 sugar isomerase [Enterococcus cecorum]MDM8182736.1 SIS domain-containing protein [Enterococcus cecorum]MDZ5504010.1 SIS domain-containing protein [Enterococcus cecorum]MDZ5531207.1 SIS domain-containing protein [Enterococcus cecorum]